MNKKRLLSKMALYGDTGLTLAKALRIANTSFSAKINGVREFTQCEIMLIKARYNLTPDEIDAIFFSSEVE